MPRAKGTPKTGGRQKDTPNKLTASLKEAIQQAATAAHPEGMVGYLTQQAQTNPNAFLSLLGRTLPKEITGGEGQPLFPARIEIVGVRANPKP